jgi:predicted ATPase
MKIKAIHLRKFRRFSDLTIDDLPEAKLVVMAGPNGSGKTSLLDAFAVHRRTVGSWGVGWEPAYHSRDKDQPNWTGNQVEIQFHGPTSGRKTYYLRSAYRNESDFKLNNLARQDDPVDQLRVNRMIDQDSSVSQNFQMLASNALEDAFDRYDGSMSLADFREGAIGDIKRSVGRLFPDLQMNTLGNPLAEGTFRFTKGDADGFSYMNLSGGEKAAFDLLLDLVVKSRTFDDTVYAIDEPETHMNSRLQGALLGELYDLIPENSQLWIATHSIGMMRKALEIHRANPGQVVFLDFEGHDYDQPVTMRPVQPNRAFWERILRVALDDLAELVAPKHVILCEGNPVTPVGGKNEAHDARCYNAIFERQYPDCKFASGGNSHDVANDRLKFAAVFPEVISGVEVSRLIDRDDHAASDIADMSSAGLTVLSRRNIESYLYDDEVISKLYDNNGRSADIANALAQKASFLAASVARGNPPDDLKSAAPQIYDFLKRDLGLTGCGNNQMAFARECLAPLIEPGMATYSALETDIFGP